MSFFLGRWQTRSEVNLKSQWWQYQCCCCGCWADAILALGFRLGLAWLGRLGTFLMLEQGTLAHTHTPVTCTIHKYGDCSVAPFCFSSWQVKNVPEKTPHCDKYIWMSIQYWNKRDHVVLILMEYLLITPQWLLSPRPTSLLFMLTLEFCFNSYRMVHWVWSWLFVSLKVLVHSTSVTSVIDKCYNN